MSARYTWGGAAITGMRPLAAALFAVIAVAGQAADLPPLGKQLDDRERPFGKGSCETVRTGVWETQGGLIVEIRKPKGYCTFQTLEFVVGSDRFQSVAVDDSFYYGKRYNWMTEKQYEWYRGNAGRVFFKAPPGIQADQIKGVWEKTCSSQNCLHEPAAAPN